MAPVAMRIARTTLTYNTNTDASPAGNRRARSYFAVTFNDLSRRNVKIVSTGTLIEFPEVIT